MNGTGFQSGLTVTLSTSSGTTHPAASQITPTSFQITAVFATGNYTLSVTNPGGQPSAAFAFSAATATAINFSTPVGYATGATTQGPNAGSGSIALADFNGDGRLDIGVSNFGSKTVAVLLNKGDGTFGSAVLTTVDSKGALGLGAIVAGDFNEDGKQDLIVGTIAGLQSDIVLLGNNDGTFTQANQIPNSFGFFHAYAVDLNGDKHLDLIAAQNGTNTVALGKGDGTFNPGVALPSGPAAMPDTDLGDLTGSGKLDFVGVNSDPHANGIYVFRGNGNGTFQTPTSQSLNGAVSIALADFNGDGKLDALVGYYGPAGAGIGFAGTAKVALGLGNGTFQLTPQVSVYTVASGLDALFVRAADLDQDGRPDALVSDYTTGVFAVILNNASSISSGTKSTFTLAPGLADIATGDLNADGMPDVLLVNSTTNQVSVVLSH